MKKLLAMIVTLSLVFGLALPVCAAEQITYQENTNEISPRLSVIGDYALVNAIKTGSTVSAAAWITGQSNATSSYVRIDLYRKAAGASTYTLWKSGTTKNNPSGGYVETRESFSTVSGYTYKVVSTHTAYAGSLKETRTLERVV